MIHTIIIKSTPDPITHGIDRLACERRLWFRHEASPLDSGEEIDVGNQANQVLHCLVQR
jgi:hypothetical protein